MEYMSAKCPENELADHPQGLPFEFHGIGGRRGHYPAHHGIVQRHWGWAISFADKAW